MKTTFHAFPFARALVLGYALPLCFAQATGTVKGVCKDCRGKTDRGRPKWSG